MKLSTRARYGIRAILDLAEHSGGGPIQLKNIARHQDISVKYLEQLIAILKSAGFVRSVRGSKGGYVLAKAPNEIKLIEVFNCMEGPVTTAECVESADVCARSADCAVRQIWAQVQDAIRGVLESVTLQDLVKMAGSRKTADYQI